MLCEPRWAAEVERWVCMQQLELAEPEFALMQQHTIVLRAAQARTRLKRTSLAIMVGDCRNWTREGVQKTLKIIDTRKGAHKVHTQKLSKNFNQRVILYKNRSGHGPPATALQQHICMHLQGMWQHICLQQHANVRWGKWTCHTQRTHPPVSYTHKVEETKSGFCYSENVHVNCRKVPICKAGDSTTTRSRRSRNRKSHKDFV